MSAIIEQTSRVILFLNYFYVRILGIGCITYNNATSRVTLSHGWLLYSVVLHIFLLSMLPRISEVGMDTNVFSTNMVLSIAMYVNGFGTIAAVIGMVIIQLINRHKLVLVFNGFFELVTDMRILNDGQFYSLRFLVLMLMKFTIPFNQAIASIRMYTLVVGHFGPWVIVSLSISSIIVHLLAAIMNLFYLGMLFMWQSNEIINYKLHTVLDDLKEADSERKKFKANFRIQKFCDASEIIDILSGMHSRVYMLSTLLQDTFQFQNIALMLQSFMDFILKTFFLYSFATTQRQNQWHIFLTASETVIVGFVEFLLFIYAADLANAMSWKTMENLHQHLAPIRWHDERFERSVDTLSSEVLLKKVTIKLGGFCVLDRKFARDLLNGTLIHVFMLIQYEKILGI